MERLATLVISAEPENKIAVLEQLVTDLWYVVQDLQDSISVSQKTAPAKPREGMVRYANGVGWNPGSGAGLYQYISGTWNKL